MVQYFVYRKSNSRALGLDFEDFITLIAKFYSLKDAELFLKYKRKTSENFATSFYIQPYDDDKGFIDFEEAKKIAKKRGIFID